MNKRKPGPRQGWVNDLKAKVQKLQSEVAYGAHGNELVAAQVMLHPSSFGPTEMPLLEGFFLNSNSLLPVVAHTTAEAFRRHIETPATSHQATSARSALYNGVVALSILLQLPDHPSKSEDSVVNSANAAISPYFQLANNAMKETFASPSVDAISALLVLSNCHQLMNDSQTSFLYTTYATAMCGQLRECPSLIRNSCKFLADVRATTVSQLTPIEPFGGMQPGKWHENVDHHARFLTIMAHLMVLLRAQHCPFSRARVQEMYGSSQHILALIEEAQLLTETNVQLPRAAAFWVAAAKARFMVNAVQQAGSTDMSEPAAAYQGLLQMIIQQPTILRDPYAVYICYSLTWIVLDLPKSAREQFPNFIHSMSRLAEVWPLAEAMLQILQVDSTLYEKPTLCALFAKKASLSLEAPPPCMQKAAEFQAKEAAVKGQSLSTPQEDQEMEQPPVKRATPSGSSLEDISVDPTRDNSSESVNAEVASGTPTPEPRPIEYGVPNFTPEETELIAEYILSSGTGDYAHGTNDTTESPEDRLSLEDFDFDLNHLDSFLENELGALGEAVAVDGVMVGQ